MQRNRLPIYIAEVPEGHFYGLPMIDPNGHKVARHYGAPEFELPLGSIARGDFGR